MFFTKKSSASNSNVTTLKLFNTLFRDFIDFIKNVCREDTVKREGSDPHTSLQTEPTEPNPVFDTKVNDALETASSSFDLIRRANPTIICKFWKSHVYLPYRDVIDRSDITFIATKNYEQDLSMFSNVDEILTIIDSLRDPIRNMNSDNQAKAMKMIENLSKLAMIY